MKRLIALLSTLVLVACVCGHQPLPKKNVLAEYLQTMASMTQRFHRLAKSFYSLNPQNVLSSALGYSIDTEHEFDQDADLNLDQDAFSSSLFNEKELAFIKTTILNHAGIGKKINGKVPHPYGFREQKEKRSKHDRERVLQETTFDESKTSSVSEEDAYTKEQQDILNAIRGKQLPRGQFFPASLDIECQQNSKMQNMRVEAYVCNDATITKVQYDAVVNKSACIYNRIVVQACSCSFDHYGRYCQKFVGLNCTATGVTPYDQKCLKEYTDKYGGKRLGYPPCRHFENDQYSFKAQVDCGLTNVSQLYRTMDFNREGIKLEYLMATENNLVHTLYMFNIPNFTYAMVNDKVCLHVT